MTSTGPGDRAYYLDDFVDEIMPCSPTLEAWAEWLSKPAPDWSRTEAAADRSTFNASILRFEEDIVATKGADGWTFSRPFPEEPGLVAARFGAGMGWSPENIIYPDHGQTWEEAVRAFLDDEENDTEPVEHIAIAMDEPSVVLMFKHDPPRLIVQGMVQ